MPENPKSAPRGVRDSVQPAVPQLSLPKGGGAIRGIGEKFAANPVTGTGTMTVPIKASPGRSGFGPRLALSYDSGRGTSPFGFGWSLDLPLITRKTDKGLPRYRDEEESDVFILSGAEDLVPALTYGGGAWTREVPSPRTVYGKQYLIHRYRPRVEGLFARIERWANPADPQDTFWRSISRDNITSWYGKTAESRIFDPTDAGRIFSWLICESHDDKGNVISYRYKPEDSTGIDASQPCEGNRTTATRSANRYIKYVLYGNRAPYFPDLTTVTPVAPPTDWCFQLVFDYGEHDLSNPLPQDTGRPWDCRQDPFSSYRPTFEVRTYRLCRRVLMFHHFADQPNVGVDCLVHSTDLGHAAAPPPDPTQPFYSYLLSVTQTGYVRDGSGGYLAKSLPPLQLEYTRAEVDETVREIDAQSLKNLPYGLDGSDYRWVDLDGEGVSGILTEQGGSWLYKPNWSPGNRHEVQEANGDRLTLPWFGPVETVGREPSLAALRGGRQRLMDLSGDGRLALVEYSGLTPGFFERTEHRGWRGLRSFPSLPVLDWQSPNMRLVDLTGDGFPDLLITEDEAFTWHASLASGGFAAARLVARALDEERGPKLIFADGTESVFLADMSGDGLTDLVRIRNGEVCYWPNLGYGRFGTKVTMSASPCFDRPDLFDGRRISLADIDGSGTADIIYFGSGEVDLYFNQCGNGWAAARALRHFPMVESVSSATALDLLGNGTACLVWSSALPGNARWPMRYIDLMGGVKPHLLVSARNNLGAETRVEYAPSTRFYTLDKLAGTPWLMRLPFPVQVVERVETYDYISRNRFATRYSYHHGYFDGVEREFRGFGRVDQCDTGELATLSTSSSFPAATNESQASNLPPVLTRTWFHTGVYFDEPFISRHFAAEYYSEGDAGEGIAGLTQAQLAAMRLSDSAPPTNVLLADGTRLPWRFSTEAMREACRALRGSILRQEIYALDDSEAADRPYTASERNYTIEALQPRGPNPFGAFFVHEREAVEFHYERKLLQVNGNSLADPKNPPPGSKPAADPRVTHDVTLAVDPLGNVLQSASIAYGRRYLDPLLTPADQACQSMLLSTYKENTYTNDVSGDDIYRARLATQSSVYELIQVQPGAAEPGVTNLFGFVELQAQVKAASDGAHEISYENLNPSGLAAGQPYRRLIRSERTRYRPDDLGASAGDAATLLPLGTLESLALPGEKYMLAFTAGLVTQVYDRAGAALLPTPASVLASTAADGGGYADLDGDGRWWVRSGRQYYYPGVTTPGQEKTQATQNFYLLRRFEDPFGNSASVDYEGPHDLLPVKTADAAGNVASVSNDYRVLAPTQLTDPNGNRTQVRFDALGMVVGTAVMGKVSESLGDSFDSFVVDLTQAQIDGFYAAADPHTAAGSLLGTASTRIVYDIGRFLASRQAAPDDPTQWQPVFAATIACEAHMNGAATRPSTRLQLHFSYSDGLGREIQKKVNAEPGPIVDGGPNVDPRWVASGWTIYNNKSKPVRQYEPFFSQLALGHQFEFGVQVGVSPILCYDPVARVVATLHPQHTYDKVVFDPWRQESWDANDTVLQTDVTSDPEVGSYFKRIASADYSPSWYAQRIGGGLGAQEQAAAQKASKHADTPTVSHVDVLGRAFLTTADNAGDGKYSDRVELDIEGNSLAVRDAVVQAGDAQGRIVMRRDYNMLRATIHQASMEAGESWTLHDTAGKTIRGWDSRGHDFRTEYDGLRRATGRFVLGTDAANSDPRTLAGEVQYEKAIYGESQTSPEPLNLRGRVYQQCDCAGTVTNVGHNPSTNQDEGFDFKGNLLRNVRAFVADYKSLPDWRAPPATAQSFSSSSQYDALNRATGLTTPDGSVIQPAYNEAGLLGAITANVRGASPPTSFITGITYNAKAQRILIQYGNGAETHAGYDPQTFRLCRLYTRRGASYAADCGAPPPPPLFAAPADPPKNVPCGLQNLTYIYDPVGNITHVRDDAQQTIYFRNQRVEPSADYTYDAIYRLIAAIGREHLGLNGGGPLPPAPSSYNDTPRVGLAHPNDGNAMGIYAEQYQYDPVGNFEQVIHRGSDPANSGWTRSYAYGEASPLEPGKTSNRLSGTAVSGTEALNEPYAYDRHGDMTAMPQLQSMQWDFKSHLSLTQRQAVSASDQDGTQHQGERTYYVYDAEGQRVRKATESAAGIKIKERFYLGVFELYQEYGSGGNANLARESLHVMDDKKRVAIVETQTVGPGGAIASPSSLPRYQFDNHLGSAVLELDGNAAIISYEEYYPFGSTSYQGVNGVAEVSLKRYRYSGKERDEETGLYYYGARYYAAWLGRWASCDPAGMVDGPNLYSYVRNCPTRLSDPTGTQSQPRQRHHAAANPGTVIPVDLRRMNKQIHHVAKQAKGHADPVLRLPPHVPHVPELQHAPDKPTRPPEYFSPASLIEDPYTRHFRLFEGGLRPGSLAEYRQRGEIARWLYEDLEAKDKGLPFPSDVPPSQAQPAGKPPFQNFFGIGAQAQRFVPFTKFTAGQTTVDGAGVGTQWKLPSILHNQTANLTGTAALNIVSVDPTESAPKTTGGTPTPVPGYYENTFQPGLTFTQGLINKGWFSLGAQGGLSATFPFDYPSTLAKAPTDSLSASVGLVSQLYTPDHGASLYLGAWVQGKTPLTSDFMNTSKLQGGVLFGAQIRIYFPWELQH